MQGVSSIPSGAISLGSGATPVTLQVNGSVGSSSSRTITLNGPATIDSSGTSDPLTLSGSVTSNSNQSLTLTGINEGDLYGQVNLGSGTLTVNGSGPGSLWIIRGTANTIGATVVNSGLLKLTNASGSALGSGPVTINGGTLDALQYAESIGTLTVGDLGTLNLSGTNTLTTTGLHLATTGGTLNLFNLTNSSETEDLINYGSTGYSGSFAAITGVPSVDKVVYNATQLDLVKAAIATTYSMSTAASSLAIHVSTASNQTSATITTRLFNTGTTGMDTIDYSGLQAGVSPSSGTLGTVTGGSGTGLALGASGTATQGFASATAGSYSFMPLVTSATNTVAGGPATWSGTRRSPSTSTTWPRAR